MEQSHTGLLAPTISTHLVDEGMSSDSTLDHISSIQTVHTVHPDGPCLTLSHLPSHHVRVPELARYTCRVVGIQELVGSGNSRG